MRRLVTTLTEFASVVAAFVGLALVLLSAGHAAPPAHGAVFVAEPAADTGQALMTALQGEGTDYDPAQAATLVELAHRYCTTVVHGQIATGAEVQTREGWVATLTMPQPSPTTGWTAEEADAFLAAAQATYCPAAPAAPADVR